MWWPRRDLGYLFSIFDCPFLGDGKEFNDDEPYQTQKQHLSDSTEKWSYVSKCCGSVNVPYDPYTCLRAGEQEYPDDLIRDSTRIGGTPDGCQHKHGN